MQLLNKKQNLRILVLISCFILISGRVFSNDSLYVRFIDKKIDLMEQGFYCVVKIKRLQYIFSQEKCDSSINCFVFQRNKLISSGRLIARKMNAQLWAERKGYWSFFGGKKKRKRIYFVNDEPIKEEQLPIDEANNSFYIKD